jgi:hypothetical protein
MPDATLRRLLQAVCAATVASGAFQALLPGVVLRVLRADRSAPSRHLFATIGMFMVVVGGGFWQALGRPARDPVIALWAALQKWGAAGAVALGVRRGVFSPVALAVAAFDAVSGVLVLEWWRRSR